MTTIETTQVDAYVQAICKDRLLSAFTRGQHAAAAIGVHVAQVQCLLIGTAMLVDEADVLERIDRINERHEQHLTALLPSVNDDAFETELLEAMTVKIEVSE